MDKKVRIVLLKLKQYLDKLEDTLVTDKMIVEVEKEEVEESCLRVAALRNNLNKK